MRHCELEHEIPSEHELRAYVLCYLEMSPFVGLVPELPLATDQKDSFVKQGVFEFAELGGDSFARLGVDTIQSAHTSLNELPRTDSFWEDSNRRPTRLKVSAFCKRRLNENPFDVDALLTLAVMQSASFANDFGQHYWARLIAVGAETLRMPTFAALLTELTAHRSAAQWAAFVTLTKRVEEARPFAEEFAGSPNEYIAGWGMRALRALRFCSRREV